MLVAPLHYPATAQLPTRLSALSPLSPNAIHLNSQSLHFGMNSSDNDSAKSEKSYTYSRRAVKPTPFNGRTRDLQRQRQREIFLRRVEQTRDDKRWEGRGEEILRCDHFAQQRKRQEALERQADDDAQLIEAELAAPSSNMLVSSYDVSQSRSPFQIFSDPLESEVDDVAQQERLELEEWTAFIAQTEGQDLEAEHHRVHESETQTTDYDDDEYDDLFMDLIDRQPQQSESQIEHGQLQDTEMDLSP